MKYFRQDTPIAVPPAEAFAWHEREQAFERLSPPWETLTIAERRGGIRDGGVLAFDIHKGPVRVRWVAEHYGFEQGRQFCDRSARGPFPHWQHRHLFEARGDNACVIRDEVEYSPPLGPVGELLPACLLDDKIAAMFAYRQLISREDITRHHEAARHMGAQRVLVTGSSGFVGRRLVPFLTTGGHRVDRLLRNRPRGSDPGAIVWDPGTGFQPAAQHALEGTDAVIHLAGESVMGLWTAGKKARIRDSRVGPTRLLCEALARMERKPRVLVAASAIGLYGNRGDEALAENSAGGTGFLADVAREWEAATAPAREAGIRVVNLRIGVVLGPDGGALGAMLPAALAGVAGPIGSGSHWMSWITREDLIHLIHFCLYNESMVGPVNATAPNPATNLDFMRALGRALGRPMVLPVPAFLLRATVKELAENVLMSDQRVLPAAAQAAGFRFALPDLEPALRLLCGRQTKPL